MSIMKLTKRRTSITASSSKIMISLRYLEMDSSLSLRCTYPISPINRRFQLLLHSRLVLSSRISISKIATNEETINGKIIIDNLRMITNRDSLMIHLRIMTNSIVRSPSLSTQIDQQTAVIPIGSSSSLIEEIMHLANSSHN